MAVTLFSLWTKSQLWWALVFSSLILPGETVTAEAGNVVSRVYSDSPAAQYSGSILEQREIKRIFLNGFFCGF